VKFDAATLRRIDAAYEVDIETTRPDGTVRQTTIWAVVEAGEVFVRSVRGERGYWYQAALDRPTDVYLVVDGERIPVRAVAATHEVAITRCSNGLSKKYRDDASLPSMLRAGVLATTIRLEPR
jgi:Uncharacterized protein conserved in bacteria (DUF2255).